MFHTAHTFKQLYMNVSFFKNQNREVLIDLLPFTVLKVLLWLFDVCVTGGISRQKADEALLLHHRGPVCERPVAGAALPGESQS